MNILVCYWQFPEHDKHSTALRITEIVSIFLKQGDNVTFFADHRFSYSKANEKYKQFLENSGVECFSCVNKYPQNITDFIELISKHKFDVAVFLHYFIFNDYASQLRKTQPDCHLILDTVDLHFLREKRQAEVTRTENCRKQAENTRLREFRALQDADSVWVVTEKEKEILLKSIIKIDFNISVIPNIHRNYDKLIGFEKTNGIVFLGGYRFPPNKDAIEFFMKEIHPILNKSLPGLKITIAGSSPPKHFSNYKDIFPNVNVSGFIKDHRTMIKSHRVAIAPLRFGAGMKGKIGEYLCCGLPVVTTSIGAEGFGFNGNEVIIADNPKDFAKGVIQLYSYKEIWETYRNNGVSFMKQFTPESVGKKMRRIIKSLDTNLRQ